MVCCYIFADTIACYHFALQLLKDCGYYCPLSGNAGGIPVLCLDV